MDKIRAFFSWLKRQHFWVLLVMVAGLAVTGWFLASSSVAEEMASNQSKIKSEFSQQSQLKSRPFKPNEEINKKQAEEISKLADGVGQIWRQLHDRQKEEVLIWPEKLGPKFARYMQGKKFGDSINSDYRDDYLNYINDQFPELLKIVDAEDLGEGGGGLGRRGGRGGGPGMMMEPGMRGPGMGRGGVDGPEEPAHLVEWLDQETVSSRLDMTKRPSALEIWVIQEDLWVYETLLRAIADTNEASGATRRNNAAVRVIEQLQVGLSAASNVKQATGRIFVPQDTGPSTAAGGFGMGMGMGMGRGMMGGYGEGMMMGEMGGMGLGEGDMGMGMGMGRGMGMGMGMGPGVDLEGAGTDEASILMAGRYIDGSGEPIVQVSSDYNFGLEYKRLPVRMLLEMDQRMLPELIVQLANAPLQVEIEQFRINPGDSSSSSRSRTRNAEVQSFDRQPEVALVDLKGTIYIFNEPNEEQLTVDLENE